MPETKRSYCFGPFRLDIVNKLLFKGVELVHLDAKRFEVLCFLVENPNRPISTSEILNTIWLDKVVEQNNVTQAISAIRKALGDNDPLHPYITTIPAPKNDVTKQGTKYCFNPQESTKDFQIGLAQEVQKKERKTPDTSLAIQEVLASTVGIEDQKNTFQEWLLDRSQEKRSKQVILGGILFTSVLSITFYFLNRQRAEQLASAAQLLTIMILFRFWPKAGDFLPREGNQTADQETVETLGYKSAEELNQAIKVAKGFQGQYELYWKWAWIFWAFLYLFFVTSYSDPSDKAVFIIKDVISNANTACISLCYITLYKPITGNSKPDELDSVRWTRTTFTALGCVGVPLVIEFLIILGLGIKEAAELHIAQGFSLVSGIAAGVAMALYVSRLQSKYLNPALWLILLLFFYTAVQTFYWNLAAPQSSAEKELSKLHLSDIQAVDSFLAELKAKETTNSEDSSVKKLEQPGVLKSLYEEFGPESKREKLSQIAKVALINFTLILKCLLYLYTAWILKTKRLLFYLERMGKIYQEKEWKAFRDHLQRKPEPSA
jgi:DNA-binding winged helix-turn-helix (wHTH) protein